MRADSLPWLLEETRPNVVWRALIELVQRPVTSPAVLRTRSGANVVEPLAFLLADLLPDGAWANIPPAKSTVEESGWRLVKAGQWGADPDDPRLGAACERFLETVSGEGGFSRREIGDEESLFTARVLAALAEFGWFRHPRFDEGIAWLEEAAPITLEGGWAIPEDRGEECAVTPVALLGVLKAGNMRRQKLLERSLTALKRILATGNDDLYCIQHPNLERTDLAEILWTLARSNATLDPLIVTALHRLQSMQDSHGTWHSQTGIVCSDKDEIPGASQSRWLTLKSAVAVMHYAVKAELPRLYPEKP